jgi:hypothetical protein
MPLILSAEEQSLLLELAAPIEQRCRDQFMSAVAAELKNAAAVGPGAVHRVARSILRQFWSPPADLRQDRIGPRGPRNA